MNLPVRLISIFVLAQASHIAWANDAALNQHHRSIESSVSAPQAERSCGASLAEGFESVQIETSNIRLYEQLFEAVLQVPVLQRADHPGVDSLRGYCYRGLVVVVRQDLRTSRPTGWVQLNFAVPDVATLQKQLEEMYRASSVSQLSEEDRARIVRFRLKPDVMRGDRRVVRLEIAGPEGFMIGFDQVQ